MRKAFNILTVEKSFFYKKKNKQGFYHTHWAILHFGTTLLAFSVSAPLTKNNTLSVI
jgi:hypothetical protein